MAGFEEKASSMNDIITDKINMSLNSFLGNFTIDNDYVINDEVKDELLRIRKIRRNSYKNLIFCSTTLKDYGNIVYEVSFQKDEETNIAKANLFLLESADKINGYVKDTIKTKIGEYTDVFKPMFVDEACKHFNIISLDALNYEPNSEEVSINDSYLEAKIKLEQHLAFFAKNGNNEVFETYFKARINLLRAQDTEFSRAVLQAYSEEYNKILKFFLNGDTVDYKALSELLDKSIQSVRGTKQSYLMGEAQYFKDLEPIIEAFGMEIAKIRDYAMEEAMVKAEKAHDSKAVETILDSKHKSMGRGGSGKSKSPKSSPSKSPKSKPSKSKGGSIVHPYWGSKPIAKPVDNYKITKKQENKSDIKGKNEDVDFSNIGLNDKDPITSMISEISQYGMS